MTQISDVTQELEKMRDIFILLDPHDCELSERDKEKKEDLLELFGYFAECSKHVTDYHHIKMPLAVKTNFSNIVPRFVHLLRECVLTHQWPEALKIVDTLTKELRGTDSIIWKVGQTCLYQGGKQNKRLVEQFVRHLYVLRDITAVEVLLDYLLFLLVQSELEDAKNLVKELKECTRFRCQLTNDKRKMAHTLFYAYQGLTLYAEWKMAIFKADQEESERDFISHMLSHSSDGLAVQAIAKAAIEYLVTVKEKAGVWDIFITRLVEIYQYYDKVGEARSLLMLYREKNPTNPNAHRYLYEFECDNDGEKSVQLDCLMEIVKLDPCNPLCLKLYFQIETDEPDAVHLLFDFLDYNHNKDNEEVWEALVAKVEDVSQNEEVAYMVKTCWDIRKDWWPNVIFGDDTKQISTRLSMNKKRVYQTLLKLGKRSKT